jgi:molybdate transport system substrate-binding protein
LPAITAGECQVRTAFSLGLLLSLVLAAAPLRCAPAESAPLTVFAAASLAESLQQLASAYEKESGVPVRVSFAGSGTLARQIEAGAPAEVFISADVAWMDELSARKLIVPESRRVLLTNRLVLVAPVSSTVALKLAPNAPVAAALRGGPLALADPDNVPAGRYAKAAFTALGIWPALEGHLVRGEDVRAALLWVARGEAPLGVVYATDARAEPRVRVVDSFPADSHPAIEYPIALVTGASARGAKFVAFLESPVAGAVFVSHGFGLP